MFHPVLGEVMSAASRLASFRPLRWFRIPALIAAVSLALPSGSAQQSLTDSQFFGVWNGSSWTTVGKLNYAYSGGTNWTAVETAVKAVGTSGNYGSAKTALLTYFKNRTTPVVETLGNPTPSGGATYASEVGRHRIKGIANLAVNRTFLGPQADTLVGEITVSGTGWSTVSLTSTDAVNSSNDPSLLQAVRDGIASNAIGFLLMGKNKPESVVAAIQSKEASSNRPTLEVVINGTTHTRTAVKDTYIQGSSSTGFGNSSMLLVNASGLTSAAYDSGECRTYLVFDLSTLPKDYVATSATLKLYAHTLTAGTKVLYVFQNGDTTWTEAPVSGGPAERIWTNTPGSIYSWKNASGGVPWTAPTNADKQFIDVINRANYVTPLASMYKFAPTGSEFTQSQYAQALFELMTEFAEDVPDGHPCELYTSDPTKAPTLDVGFHLSQLVTAYHNAKDSSVLTADQNTAIVKAFWGDAAFLADPANFSPLTNWGFYETNGLYRTAFYFPEFTHTPGWRSIAETRLQYIMTHDIFPDYSYGEAGLSYQLGTIGSYNSLKLLAGTSFDPVINNLLLGSAYVAAHLTDGDGYLAQYGDTDWTFAAPTIKAVGDAYGDATLKYVGSLRTEGDSTNAPTPTSKLFPYGKLAAMRSSWTDNDGWLFINNGQAALHGHPDLLSLELSAYGRRLVVSPGRYLYDNQNSTAVWLREKTVSQNTVEVGGVAMDKNASSKVVSNWRTNAGFDFFQGSHNGYASLGVTHFRDILYVKPEYWIVSDTLVSANGTHDYNQTWHFKADAALTTPNSTTDRVTTSYGTGANLQVMPADPNYVTASLDSGYYSAAYGVVATANYISYRKSGAGTMTFDTVLYPTPPGASTNVTVSRSTTVAPVSNPTAYVSAAVATGLNINTNSTGAGDLGYYYLAKGPNPTTAYIFGSSGAAYSYDGRLAYVQTTSAGVLKNAIVSDGKTLAQGTTNLISATQPIPALSVDWLGTNLYLNGQELVADNNTGTAIAIYAPSATAVYLNGSSVAYNRGAGSLSNYVYAVRSATSSTAAFIKAPRVAASASSSLASWPASNLIDNNASTLWSTTNQASQTGLQWAQVDMGTSLAVKKVTLTPRSSGVYVPALQMTLSLGFPWDFKILTSTNGTSWDPVPGQSFTRYGLGKSWSHPKQSDATEEFYFTAPVTCRYVRVESTMFSNDASGNYVQLAEITPYYEATVAASYRGLSLTELAGWEASKVRDGSIATNYSSAAQASATNAQWVGLDLGGSYTVNKILLSPRASGTTIYCFPVDFKLQWSTDGNNWFDVSGQSYTNYPNPTSDSGQIFTFGSAVTARYFRVYASKLRTDGGSNYYLQMAEMYAY